jgi:TfoX/Sxy family transcriptional regulator of competence genes
MAYDEGLAQRVREALEEQTNVTEKKMFGGLAFLLGGNMCVGIVGEELMVRVGSQAYENALGLPHAREMDFTGRSMKGFVYVGCAGFEADAALQDWLEKGIRFTSSLPAK